jgi:hypothetical protein
MEEAHHFILFNDKHGGLCNRGSLPNSNRLSCETAFSQKVAGSQHCQDAFFASCIDHRKFHAPLLNVHHSLGGNPLCENRCLSGKLNDLSRHTRRLKKSLGVKSCLVVAFHIITNHCRSPSSLTLSQGAFVDKEQDRCHAEWNRACPKCFYFVEMASGIKKAIQGHSELRKQSEQHL